MKFFIKIVSLILLSLTLVQNPIQATLGTNTGGARLVISSKGQTEVPLAKEKGVTPTNRVCLANQTIEYIGGEPRCVNLKDEQIKHKEELLKHKKAKTTLTDNFMNDTGLNNSGLLSTGLNSGIEYAAEGGAIIETPQTHENVIRPSTTHLGSTHTTAHRASRR